MAPGIPFVVSAPSGAGKSTLVRGLREGVGGLGFSVSHTTRAPRVGEVDGREYHFVPRARFQEMVAANAFAEWAEVHGNLYGTSHASLDAELERGRDVLLDIDVQGALQLAERRADAVLIFILPPSLEVLRRRLEGRASDAPEVIATRLGNARAEIAIAGRYHYLVVNDTLTEAVDELRSIVVAERCRAPRRADRLQRFAAP